ncbi:MAG: RsmB/NOP family class I SAM-dependent RNA methyltransferase [Methylotenera sp.]
MNANLIRQAAVVLANLLDFNSPADAKLSDFFRNNRDLGTKDRAFVAESVYGVLRRLRYLSAVTANEENDPDDSRKLILAWLLRVQGKSIREMESVLNEQQTEWAHTIKAKSTENLPLAVQADVRDWLWDKLVAQYGESEALTICRSMHEQASLDLRVNTIKGNREDTLKRMLAENTSNENTIEITPHSPIGIRMPGRMNISKHVLFTEGKIEVQDEGSQLLSYLVAPKRGQMVADFCAGAGGKTLAIGALMKNTGRLYAFDVSEKRLMNLGKRLKRSGLSNLHAQAISSEADPKLKRLNGKFDRVLVDAPCSGFGTLRRNPDLKWRFEEKDIAELNVKQAAILARAAKLTKAGGRLIYGTCSLLSDENENIAEAFLSANADFVLLPANEILSQQQIKLDTGKYLKLLPHLHGTDGFFAAVFERKVETDKANIKSKITALEGNIHEDSGASPTKPKAAKAKKIAKEIKATP